MLRRVLALATPLVALPLFALVFSACKTKPVGDDGGVKIDLTAPSAASAAPTVDAGVGIADDDEEPGVEGDGGCPLPIHPNYCRRNCRGYSVRSATHHASRIHAPAAFALGTCGPYKVFAENEANDAGIVEYFDDAGALVAAEDRRAQGCGKYGAVPSCTPVLKWAPPATIKLGGFTATGLPPEVVQRIVRQNTGRYRLCYEDALTRVPTLKGKVVVGFDLTKDGSPTGVKKATGTDVTDDAILQCITKATSNLSFPSPDGGKGNAAFEIELAPKAP